MGRLFKIKENYMGWYGYGIYDGDDTQTRHLDYCKWAKLYENDNDLEWQEKHLLAKGTILNKDEQKLLLKNVNLVLEKMPKYKFWNKYNALEWQMLLALFVDNKLSPPKIIKENGIIATEYLTGDDATNFTNVGARRRVLNNFIKKATQL